MPAIQIPALDKNWSVFASQSGFNDLHASECAAHNPRSSFAGWDDDTVSKVFGRACQIAKRHVSHAIAFTIHKDDFDAEAPLEWRKVGGQNHYTWAFRNALIHTLKWAEARNVTAPFEYVFDWAEKPERDEIEMVMAQFESGHPGKFDGHYIFKKREDVPGLQCADLLAWSCYSRSRFIFRNTPMKDLAEESFMNFSENLKGTWLQALTHTRENLRKSIALDCADSAAEEKRRVWYENYVASLEQKKGKKSK